MQFWRAVVCGITLCAISIAQQKSVKPAPELDAVEQHFQAAQTYQLAEDLPHAATEYRKAIGIGLQRLGNFRSSQRDYDGAVDLLTRATQIDPSNSDAAIDLAVAHFYLGEFPKAKLIIDPIMGADSRNYRALNLMGKIEFMQGNFQAAADRLQAALAIKADFDVAYSLALADLQLKKVPQATVLFDEMKASMKSSPELLILIGRAYRESGMPEQAATEFRRAIAANPKAPHAHALLGLTYLMLGESKYPEAKQQFESELALSPADNVSRYYLGVVEIQLHELGAAETDLKKVVQQDAPSPNAYLHLGQAYLQEGKLEDAESALRRAIAVLPETADRNAAQAHAMLAEALQKQGKTSEATAESALAEKLKPGASPEPGGLLEASSHASKSELSEMLGQAARKSAAKPEETRYVESVSKLLAEAYHNLGVIDAREARYSAAADEFAQAYRWNPEISTLDRNWGVAAFRAGQYDQATGPLTRQLKRTPEDSALRQMLGVSYFMTDEFTKSAEAFRPILSDLPENPGVLYAAGTALVRSGDSRTAGTLFQHMLEQGTNVPEIHLVLGQVYSEQDRYSEAFDEFERAASLNPSLADVHYFKGMVEFKQGKLEEAGKDFEEELSVNPHALAAMYQLAYVRLQQSQPEQAVPLLTKVLNEKPSYADAHYELGKALLELNDVSGAIPHLETATKMQPNESYGFYQLSIAYRRAGRVTDADRALHTYQDLKDKRPGK